jgi:hypothetical protein
MQFNPEFFFLGFVLVGIFPLLLDKHLNKIKIKKEKKSFHFLLCLKIVFLHQ